MSDHPPIEVLITNRFSDALMEQLRELSPRLRITHHHARRADEIPNDLWERCEVLYTDSVLPDPQSAPNLRWVQFHYAGIDFAIDSPLLQKPDLLVTTLSGANALQTSEYVIMMLLALGHRMPSLIQNQIKAEWPRDRDRWERFSPVELHNATVGLVGYGSIARETARLLKSFQTTVLAAKRDVRHPEDSGYHLPGLGDPNGEYFDRLYPIEAITPMIKLCDFVVITLPLNQNTRGLIGEKELRAMKPSAYLVDIGRGGVVQHDALIEALQENRLAGAALDVFPEEPLPSTSPLWRMPNVLMSPHIAGISPHYPDRAVALFCDNLTRYLSGQPLLNRYDLSLRY